MSEWSFADEDGNPLEAVEGADTFTITFEGPGLSDPWHVFDPEDRSTWPYKEETNP